jgi:hypothetical protein
MPRQYSHWDLVKKYSNEIDQFIWDKRELFLPTIKELLDYDDKEEWKAYHNRCDCSCHCCYECGECEDYHGRSDDIWFQMRKQNYWINNYCSPEEDKFLFDKQKALRCIMNTFRGIYNEDGSDENQGRSADFVIDGRDLIRASLIENADEIWEFLQNKENEIVEELESRIEFLPKELSDLVVDYHIPTLRIN